MFGELITMVLLKELPDDKIIISSEHTFQSGAYKSKESKICNIGVLRIPKGCSILKSIRHSVWSSTQKGNSKLNKVYLESLGKYPIYKHFFQKAIIM